MTDTTNIAEIQNPDVNRVNFTARFQCGMCGNFYTYSDKRKHLESKKHKVGTTVNKFIGREVREDIQRTKSEIRQLLVEAKEYAERMKYDY